MHEVKKPRKPLIYYYVIVLMVLVLFNFLFMPWVAERQIKEVGYEKFMKMTEEEDIGRVEIDQEENQITFTDKDETAIYKTGMVDDPDLTERLYDAGAEFSGQIIEQTSPWVVFLLNWILPILIFVGDAALLRPGRFDRRVPVELPDLAGRKAILELHTKDVKTEPGIDLTTIARATPGASGADLANIINEGALRAVRLGRKRATQEDFEESVEVVIAGQQRKSTVLSDHEKQVVAYHEIGHAIVAARQKGSAPVTKITIVPRTSGALGYTMQVEEDERFLTTKQEVLDKLAVYCGGRAAEELIFGEMTTGAANDIEQATKLARNMITRFGMSEEFGMMALGTVQNAYLNQDTSLTCAPGTAERVDAAVLKLITEAHERAMQILKENKFKLHELAHYLYKKETITGDEFMSLLTRENPLMPKSPQE